MRSAVAFFLFAVSFAALPGASPFGAAMAGEPKTVEVKIERAGEDGDTRFFNIFATIRHEDTGWDHYCDRFEVLDADTGKVLGERELAHPHEDEQPFTRMLRLPVPPGVTRVQIRAHDSRHGYEKEPVEMALPEERG